jgi:predicted AAA+ superfamily ATPase
MYGYVDPKARAREYEASVNFLVSTGTVRQIYRIKHGIVPLSEQRDEKSFELYHLDHGLLRIMAGIHYTDIDMDNVLDTLDGMLAEQYALAELYSNRNVGTLYFWISSATAKVDFVYESEGEIIPVDVQTDPHTKAQSVKVFKQRYNNSTSIRISTDDMYVNSGLVNVPLYGIWNF